MNEEKRSIDYEAESENPCIMHVQFTCEFASIAQKLYFNAIVFFQKCVRFWKNTIRT